MRNSAFVLFVSFLVLSFLGCGGEGTREYPPLPDVIFNLPVVELHLPESIYEGEQLRFTVVLGIPSEAVDRLKTENYYAGVDLTSPHLDDGRKRAMFRAGVYSRFLDASREEWKSTNLSKVRLVFPDSFLPDTAIGNALNPMFVPGEYSFSAMVPKDDLPEDVAVPGVFERVGILRVIPREQGQGSGS